MDLTYLSIGGIAFSSAMLFGLIFRQFPGARTGLFFLLIVTLIAIAVWVTELTAEYAAAMEDWSAAKYIGFFAAGVAIALLLSGLLSGMHAGG